MVNLDTETGNMADSSDWNGRGNWSRGDSTMITPSANRLDDSKCMMHSLAAGVQSSREEPAVTSNAIATDLKKVVTKVDTIEEGLEQRRRLLRKQSQEWGKLRRPSKNVRRHFS